jgi:hypothetical protein
MDDMTGNEDELMQANLAYNLVFEELLGCMDLIDFGNIRVWRTVCSSTACRAL